MINSALIFDRERGDVVKIPLTSVYPTELLTGVALDELYSPVRLVGNFGVLEP